MRCKLFVFLFCAIFSIVNVSDASAQSRFYIGGKVGVQTLSHDSSQEFPANDGSAFRIVLNPDFGFQINDSWALGMRLGYSCIGGDNYEFNGSVNGMAGIEYSGDAKLRSIGIAPYARRRLCSIGQVGLWLEGNLNYTYSYTEDDQVFIKQYGFNIFPMVTWNPGNRFTFYASLENLNLGYNHATTWFSHNEYSDSGFDFNVNAGSIARLGDISIGVYYAF